MIYGAAFIVNTWGTAEADLLFRGSCLPRNR